MTVELAVMIRSVLAADDGYIHDPMAYVFAKALGAVLDECDRVEARGDRKAIIGNLRRAIHDAIEDREDPPTTTGPRDELINALADCVVKATEYGEQDGGFVAYYLLPTGPIHRAIPLLQERYRITVRPGFDGRKAQT